MFVISIIFLSGCKGNSFYESEQTLDVYNTEGIQISHLSGEEVYEFSDMMQEDSWEMLDDENDDIIYYKKGILDIDEYILMEVASSLPMKTLCDEICKGLCPGCGIDLNKESCTCEDDYIDPRLEHLKEFFLKE